MKLNNVELLKFANEFADISKSILKKYYFKNFKVEEKNDGTLVTEIDKKIESKFRSLLKKKFPSHGVIGEEFENYQDGNEHVWIIDPLDGTHSFISGKPLFGTLICCMKNKIPIMGLIDIPIMNQRWFGTKPEFYEELASTDSKLMTSDFNQGDGGVRNGLVASGSIRGFQMYKSSNVPATTNATGQCLAGHMSSTATAQSILNIETLRDTDTFGDIVRGLHVYGRQVLRDDALVKAIYTID